MSVSDSPRLIAAAHVLHRLSTPRHPPYALCSLTVSLRHIRVIEIETKVPSRNLVTLPYVAFIIIFLQKNVVFFLQFSGIIYSIIKDQKANLAPNGARLVCDLSHSPKLFAKKERIQDRNSSGAGRARTDDPRLAKPVLSQLSYSP